MMNRGGANRIFLVEDEPALRLALVDLLKGEGYRIESTNRGIEARDRLLKEAFDLVILDVMLPDVSGFDVCKHAREHGVNTRILMLTARDQVSDKVQGFRIGADDYLTKPFDPAELLARVEALLRRWSDNRTESWRVFGNVKVDLRKRMVFRSDQRIALSEREFTVLRYLIERPGEVVTRDQLLVDVWSYAAGTTTRTVDVHIALLRQKLEPDPRNPEFIVTVHNQGYRFLG